MTPMDERERRRRGSSGLAVGGTARGAGRSWMLACSIGYDENGSPIPEEPVRFGPPDRDYGAHGSKSAMGLRPEGATPTGSGTGGPRADGTPYDPVDGPEGLTGGPIGTARPSTTAVGTLPGRDPMERPSWWPDDPTGETIDDGRWRWGEGWVDVHFHMMWHPGWSLEEEVLKIEALIRQMDNDVDRPRVGITVLSSTCYDVSPWLDEMPNAAEDVDEMVIQAILMLPAHSYTYVGRVAALLGGAYCGWTDGDPLADSYVTWARSQIEAYPFIRGFGEWILHGHGHQHDGESTFLSSQYAIAHEERLAVLVHWDLCAVDAWQGEDGTLYCAILGEDGKTWEPTTVTVAEQCLANFESFKRVVGAWPDAIFILAHCGAGPRVSEVDATGGDPCFPRMGNYTDYQDWLEELLRDHPNVYFDIAGMIGDFDEDSVLVDILRVLMADLPERFLFGMDKSNHEVFDSVDYDDRYGVAAYRDFLQTKLALPAEDIEKIVALNAITLLSLPTAL